MPRELYGQTAVVFGGEDSWATGTSFNLQVGDSGLSNGFVYYNLRNADGLRNRMNIINRKYTFEAINGKTKLSISSNTYESTYTLQNFLSNSNVVIGGIMRNKNIIRYDRFRFYYCKMYDGEKLIHNFIPCLDENDRPCMYDSVNKQTYYNIGTDEFAYGME